MQSSTQKWSTATQADVLAMPADVYLAVYAYQEELNAHSENVVLQAKRFGTPKQIAEAEDILRRHKQKGFLTPELHNCRRALSRQLNKLATPN